MCCKFHRFQCANSPTNRITLWTDVIFGQCWADRQNDVGPTSWHTLARRRNASWVTIVANILYYRSPSPVAIYLFLSQHVTTNSHVYCITRVTYYFLKYVIMTSTFLIILRLILSLCKNIPRSKISRSYDCTGACRRLAWYTPLK